MKKILPILRSFLAKELVERHEYTQLDAATKLGTTQAAISQYLNSKRGCKSIEIFSEIMPKIETTIIKTAENVAAGDITHDEIMFEFCSLCRIFQTHMMNSKSKDA